MAVSAMVIFFGSTYLVYIYVKNRSRRLYEYEEFVPRVLPYDGMNAPGIVGENHRRNYQKKLEFQESLMNYSEWKAKQKQKQDAVGLKIAVEN
mmetsp:Transcript_7553/g.20082  ORF Transcript_7553/g.20082 Transcript_7553/m.20082 type:complete len:93 (+) Transcript_7553:431-709(+)